MEDGGDADAGNWSRFRKNTELSNSELPVRYLADGPATYNIKKMLHKMDAVCRTHNALKVLYRIY